MWTVYKHTNKINGKSYVGITSRKPEQRWGKNGIHYQKTGKTHGCFYDAILKYGWDNFTHDILFENLSYDEACWTEQECIKFYNSKVPNGYNLTDGGEGTTGYNPTQEWRNRRSEIVAKGNNPKAKKVVYDNIIFDTIVDCAEYLKVTPDHIYRWVRGQSIIPKEYADKGLRLLDVEPIYKLKANYKQRDTTAVQVLYCGVVYDSIRACAKVIGVSPDVLRKWIRGENGLKANYLYLLDTDLSIIGEERKLRSADYDNLHDNFSKNKESF